MTGFKQIFSFSCMLSLTMGCQKVDNQNQGFISLSPAITETIFALQVQDQLIGRSDYCLYPEDAKSLPSFGTALTPNWEQIVASESQGIFTDYSLRSSTETLTDVMQIHQLPWLSAEDIQHSIIQLGIILQVQEKAAELEQAFQKALQPQNTVHSANVLMIMMGSEIEKGQIWYIRQDSIHGKALQAAGYNNAAPDTLNTPNMSAEQLIAINPDNILFIGPDSLDEAQIHHNLEVIRTFSEIKAVQNNRIGIVKKENAMGIGPGILEMVPKIKETIQNFQHADSQNSHD